MPAKATRRLTVFFNDGNHLGFAFEPQVDPALVVQAVKDALEKQLLIVEIEDRVVAIPFTSVQRIEVRPKPEKLPPHAIKGARLLG